MWAHLTVSLVRGYDGAPTHVVSHVQDITAQKEANLLFEATFEQSVVPKLDRRRRPRLVALNQAAADAARRRPRDALGLRVDDLLVRHPVATLWSSVHRARDAGGRGVAPACPVAPMRRVEFVATANVLPGTPHRRRARPDAAEGARGHSFGRRRRWRRSAGSPAASRTTSTTSSPRSPATASS